MFFEKDKLCLQQRLSNGINIGSSNFELSTVVLRFRLQNKHYLIRSTVARKVQILCFIYQPSLQARFRTA
ncbi:hypothetical protein ACH3XW_1985 [Acanthocheilonema viteae]